MLRIFGNLYALLNKTIKCTVQYDSALRFGMLNVQQHAFNIQQLVCITQQDDK